MMYLRLFIISVLCSIHFTALALPAWVSKVEPDSEQAIFGLASGNSIKEAKRNALLDIAGKFNTQVEEYLHQQIQRSNGAINEELNLNTHSQITLIDLSHYQYDHIEQEEDKIWVRAKLNRPEFTAEKQRQWQTTDAQFKALFERYSAPEWNLLHAIYHQQLSLVLEKQWKSFHQLSVLGAPAPQTDVERYLNYQKNLADVDRLPTIQVYEEDGDEIALLVSEKLARHQLASNIVATPPIKGISISQDDDCTQDKRNAYLCKYHITLLSSINQNTLISSAEFEARGRDYDNAKTARKKALRSLMATWNNLPLDRWLNIETIKD